MKQFITRSLMVVAIVALGVHGLSHSEGKAGTIILEGSDAGIFHPVVFAEDLAAGSMYFNELLTGLQGASPLPVLILTDTDIATYLGTLAVPTTQVFDLTGVTLSNFSALYVVAILLAGTDNPGLVTGFEPAISTFLAGGGSLGIQSYTGDPLWEPILGLGAIPVPAVDVRGFPFGGGPFSFDDNTVTAAGMAFGITAAPNLGFFGHQAYDTAFFGPRGYESLVDPPPGSFPAGFSTILARVIPEPSTMVLLGTGLAGLVAWRMRRGSS